MKAIADSIRYMLGKDEFSFAKLLDHPLWQMRVREGLPRLLNRVRIWAARH